MTGGMTRPLVCALLGTAALLCGAACGVREFVHQQATHDSSNDFGPSLAPAAPANAAVTPAPPGATGVAGAGAAAAPPVAGTPGAIGVAGSAAQSPAAITPPPGTSIPAQPAAGTPMLSGVTIDIGGKTVAKEDAIAFIHFGHSNMAGRAVGPQATRPYFFQEVHPRAWMYHVGTPLEPALEPKTAGDNSGPQFGGPGTALVKLAADMAQSKQFISLGFGKTSAYCSQFLPGSLYYDSVMKAPKAIKDRVTFGAIVILLGITERHGTASDISGYSGCINKLVTAVRNDVGRPDLPVLINDYEAEATGMLAITSAFAQSILPEIRKIPEVVSNSALVPTNDLPMEDDHHFNFDGHKIYMQRVLQIMKDKGWFPWQ
jgi:hypothetical protein